MFNEHILKQQVRYLDPQRIRDQGIVVLYDDASIAGSLRHAADDVIRVVRGLHPLLQQDTFSVMFLLPTSPDVERTVDAGYGALLDMRTDIGEQALAAL